MIARAMGLVAPLSRRSRLDAARLHALLFAIQAFLNLAQAVFPETPNGFLWRLMPLAGSMLARQSSAALGVALLALALGVWRRKRYAWTAALGLYLCAAALHSPRGLASPPFLAAVCLAGLLLAQRRVFIARSQPGAVRAGAVVWAAGAVLAAVAGAGGLAPQTLTSGPAGPAADAARALAMFLFFFDPAPGAAAAQPLHVLLYAGGALAWLLLWHGFERPLPPTAPGAPDERRRARAVVQAYGRTSMAHLALLPDKRYFFTDRGSLIAYAVYGRAALALGDPIGPPEDAAGAVDAFCEYCVQNDWLPAFCLTSAELLGVYRQAGLNALCLGHEGVIDLASFSLRGNARKTLRKRYNRLTAQGYRVQICEPPAPADTLAELRKISDEWLGMARAAEKRFFLSWFDETLLRDERLALVYAPGGSICAFTSLTPEYQLNEISIDLMRRRRGVESGAMDFLFVALLLWARDHGYDTFNLGLSPLYGVGGPSASSASQPPERFSLERFIHFAYEHGGFYDFKGLNGFKLKFHPAWAPQYMIYPGLLAMPWVGLAMARANAGEHETLWHYFSRRPPRPPDDPGLD